MWWLIALVDVIIGFAAFFAVYWWVYPAMIEAENGVEQLVACVFGLWVCRTWLEMRRNHDL